LVLQSVAEAYGVPVIPASESLAIIELSSHSSKDEQSSESIVKEKGEELESKRGDAWDKCLGEEGGSDVPVANSSGISTESSSRAERTANYQIINYYKIHEVGERITYKMSVE
jgi:hypothetical protein